MGRIPRTVGSSALAIEPPIGISVGVLCSLTLACACGPRISEFRAQPNVACANTPIVLRWNASTSGTLSSRPASASLGEVTGSGNLTVTPTVTTNYRLDVKNLFGRAHAEVDVVVKSVPNEWTPIGQSVADPSAGCDDKSVWVTANPPPELWDPRISAGNIASADGRAYRVEHGGRVVEVAPQTPSPAFADIPLFGPWKLTTALRPGEICGTETAPNNLLINIQTKCMP
jgi:hypothetical protein